MMAKKLTYALMTMFLFQYPFFNSQLKIPIKFHYNHMAKNVKYVFIT